MYVRSGAEAYVAEHDAVARPVPLPADSDWAYIDKVRKHDYLQRVVNHLGGGEICASTPEGTAFSQALMDEMAAILSKRLPYERPPRAYPDEETVLPTMAARLASTLGLPFVLSEITVGRPLDRAIIDEVAAATFLGPPKTFYGSHTTYPMYDGPNIFAVKRVARQIDDPLRLHPEA